ncbi:OLC1v1007094C1 [Oldenlandia corymbosa var. corymbosa]|uniref:OLC1v1007094C1 n=1 Tax=Oldenlandia corymbosa var. corymbosa TaxID=529605 RepID=A0AAV1DIH9_OLDCO|nr:OLC1v1007094C1 [Oldenlandia corymbosa var. corymbosa]
MNNLKAEFCMAIFLIMLVLTMSNNTKPCDAVRPGSGMMTMMERQHLPLPSLRRPVIPPSPNCQTYIPRAPCTAAAATTTTTTTIGEMNFAGRSKNVAVASPSEQLIQVGLE